VRIALVLREIARREKITPADDEVRQAMNRTAAHRGLSDEDVKRIDPVRGKSPAAIAAPSARASNGVDHEAFIEYNRGVARNEKVFQFLENIPLDP
ncbi:MAG: hypothetical protein HYT42_01905, partial [Candidatus Sungbacteria bacterium]|nr:hypothetical protein [Candidatus Sungbacteria bacterium]